MRETLSAERAANQIVSSRDMANAIRALAMAAVENAKSGQPGMPMGMAAVVAPEKLAHEGVKAAVVSMPCWELFERQSDEYRRAVLGTAPRIGVEAALRFGQIRRIGKNGAIVGMKSFGASALAGDLYKHFGITTDAVVDRAQSILGRLLPQHTGRLK